MAGLFVKDNHKNNNSVSPADLGIRAQTSVYGSVVPIVYGANRVSGNLLWYGDFTATETTQEVQTGKGGGGEPVHTGWNYSASFILGIGEGLISGLGKYWVNADQHEFANNAYFGIWGGSNSQTVWGQLASYHPTEALAYRNIAYVATANYQLGDSSTLPNLSFEAHGYGYGVIQGKEDVSPSTIIYDVLTNSRYGATFPTSKIGDFAAFNTYCLAANFIFSPVYSAAQATQQLITDLVALTNSAIYFSEGKLKIVPYGDQEISGNGVTFTPSLNALYNLTDDDFIADSTDTPIKITRSSNADAYNSVKIECLDRGNAYKQSVVEARDQVNIDIYGLRQMPTISAHQICDLSAARNIAQIILQQQLFKRNTYEFRLGIKFCLLEPTDYVTLSESETGMDKVPVRILTIEEDEDVFTVTAEDAPTGVSSYHAYNTQSGDGTSFVTGVPPGDTATPILFVPPSSLATSPLEVWIGAYGGEHWGGCEVWASYDNESYTYIGSVTAPAKAGVLSAPLPTAADPDTTNTLSVTLANGSLPSTTESGADNAAIIALVGDEIISYATATLTGSNAYDITYLRRGGYNTAVVSHAAGERFCLLDRAIFRLPINPDKAGKTVHIKLPAFNKFQSNLQSLVDVEPTEYVVYVQQIQNTEITDIVVTNIAGGFTVSYQKPSIPDFAGIKVFLSETEGFTPDASNEVYFGDNTLVTVLSDNAGNLLVNDKLYYVRLAGVSKTSNLPLVYTQEYTVQPFSQFGKDAVLCSLSATAQTFTFNGFGVADPPTQTITLTATLQNISVDTVWVAKAYNSADELLGNINLGGELNERTINIVDFINAGTDIAYAVVTVTAGELSDRMTIVKLQDGANGESYYVIIESTNGDIFRVGEARSTLLIAHVFFNGVEITDSINSSKFRWRRVSKIPNPTGDAAWNALYAAGYKQVEITIDSVESIATFSCDILT